VCQAFGAVDSRAFAQRHPAGLKPVATGRAGRGPRTPHSCIDVATTGGDVGLQQALLAELRPTP
jgi:hypothetical protein